MILEFWFDFSCPYAYLASQRIEAIATRHGATLELCPMLLGGVFREIGAGQGPMATLSPPKASHTALDIARWAEVFAVPLTTPAAHPMRTVTALRALLGLPRDHWSLAMHSLYAAYWQRGDDITAASIIGGMWAHAGIPHHLIAAALAYASTDEAKADLRARTRVAIDRGIFGAPGIVVCQPDQPRTLLWGQDRLDFVEAALSGWNPDGPTEPVGGARTAAIDAGQLPPCTATLEFYFDVASPFAYLGATQIERIARSLGATLLWRPILLGALFRSLGTADVPLFEFPRAKREYIHRDLRHWASWWGVPLHFPSRFPQKTVTAQRLLLLAPEASLAALRHRLFAALWVEDQNLEDEVVLAKLLTEVGLDPQLLVRTHEPASKEPLRVATERARAQGVFGVPTTVVRQGGRARLFWGQDRLELAARAAAGYLDCD
jgi:2-hydroxychromene-2-carboxylate isomerase